MSTSEGWEGLRTLRHFRRQSVRIAKEEGGRGELNALVMREMEAGMLFSREGIIWLNRMRIGPKRHVEKLFIQLARQYLDVIPRNHKLRSLEDHHKVI